MGRDEHAHYERLYCSRPGCDGSAPEMLIGMGPVSGLSGVAGELLRHLGYDPAEHPGLLLELEQAIGEATLEVGEQVLADHGLEVRQ